MNHELSERERAAMCHATAADARRAIYRGNRNHYVAAKNSEADHMLQRLVSIGYAVSHGSNELTGGGVCYSVTREGCAAIGLSKAATIRACGSKAEQEAQRVARNRQRDAKLDRDRKHAVPNTLALIRAAKRAIAKAKRAIERASDFGVCGKTLEMIEQRFEDAVSL